MNSGSFSNSNHSTSVSSLLSRKQPSLASTNEKRKVAQNLPAERKCQAATARASQSKACCFGGKQDLSLPDYIECSLTLQYNNSSNNYYRLLSFIVSV